MLAKAFSPFIPLFRPLYEFVYPPICLNCDEPLSENEKRICSRCWESIQPITQNDLLYREMLARLMSTGHISGLASAFHFEKDGVLQSLIHQMKYEQGTTIGVELGKRVGAALLSMTGSMNAIVIPVPLHSVRKRERGYNQSDYISKGICEVTTWQPVMSLLRRKKNTKTQTKLNLEERRGNISQAFELNKRYSSFISDAVCIVVDDVITTGATIEECARVLKSHGAKSVFAASIALADHTLT